MIIADKLHSISGKLVLSYMVILFVCLVVFLAIMSSLTNSLISTAQQNNMALVQQCQIMVDDQMQEIDGFLFNVSEISKVKQMMYRSKPSTGTDYYNIHLLMDALPPIDSMDIVDSYYIYFKNAGIVVSPDYASTRPEYNYSVDYGYNEIEYTTYYNMLFNTRHYRSLIELCTTAAGINVLPCLHSLPIDYPSDHLAVIVLQIDCNALSTLLSYTVPNGGYAYIKLPTGDIISSNKNAPDLPASLNDSCIDYGNMFIFPGGYSKYGWQYLSMQPKSTVLSPVISLAKALAIGFAIAAVVGIILAILASRYNLKPFTDISEIVDINDSPNTIVKKVKTVIGATEDLRAELALQIEQQRIAFIDSIMHESYRDEAYMRELMLNYNLHLKGAQYVVMSIYVGDFNISMQQDPSLHTMLIKSVIQHLVGENAIVHQMNDIATQNICATHNTISGSAERTFSNNNIFCIAIAINSADRSSALANVDKLAQQIYDGIVPAYCNFASISAGQPCHHIYNISRSAFQAIDAMEMQLELFSSPVVNWYLEKTDNLFISEEFEKKLIHCMRIGNEDAALDALCEYRVKHLNAETSYDIRKISIGSVINCMMKVLNMSSHTFSNVDALLAHLTEIMYINDTETQLNEIQVIIHEICSRIRHNLIEKQNTLADQLTTYINKNIANPALSIINVADKFGLSESVVMKIIKEKTGRTFAAHIEHLRIEYACHLLKHGHDPIDKVAETVGYSTNTFFKAFKRVMGITPGDYRKAYSATCNDVVSRA